MLAIAALVAHDASAASRAASWLQTLRPEQGALDRRFWAGSSIGATVRSN